MKYLLILLISFNVFSASLYKLDIHKADSNLYWTETFPSSEKLNKWLDEEKTRNYWKPAYTTTVTIINNDPTPITVTPEIQLANDISFGKGLIKQIRLLSRSNGNDVAKRISLRNTFAPIFLSLENGDYCAGRFQVNAINGNADVSAPQKAGIIAMIDAYKTCP